MIKKNLPVYYPSADSIRMEDNEEAAYILLVITDEQGNEIRKIKQDAKKGIKRVNWDGRYEVTSPINFNEPDLSNPYYSADEGQHAIPGKYFVQIIKVYNGKSETLTEKKSFELKTINQNTLPLPEQNQLKNFNKDLAEFRRIVLGTSQYYTSLKDRIKYLKRLLQKYNNNGILKERLVLNHLITLFDNNYEKIKNTILLLNNMMVIYSSYLYQCRNTL